jgi:hypothetical protein
MSQDDHTYSISWPVMGRGIKSSIARTSRKAIASCENQVFQIKKVKAVSREDAECTVTAVDD